MAARADPLYPNTPPPVQAMIVRTVLALNMISLLPFSMIFMRFSLYHAYHRIFHSFEYVSRGAPTNPRVNFTLFDAKFADSCVSDIVHAYVKYLNTINNTWYIVGSSPVSLELRSIPVCPSTQHTMLSVNDAQMQAR